MRFHVWVFVVLWYLDLMIVPSWHNHQFQVSQKDKLQSRRKSCIHYPLCGESISCGGFTAQWARDAAKAPMGYQWVSARNTLLKHWSYIFLTLTHGYHHLSSVACLCMGLHLCDCIHQTVPVTSTSLIPLLNNSLWKGAPLQTVISTNSDFPPENTKVILIRSTWQWWSSRQRLAL